MAGTGRGGPTTRRGWYGPGAVADSGAVIVRGGGARAWQFLKRNPDFGEAWAVHAATPVLEAAPFRLARQSEADRAAARFGLLAWLDPFAVHGPVSPFWSMAPMLRAAPAPADGPGLAEMVRKAGASLAGLRLCDGTLVLKVERDGAALQLALADGARFDLGADSVD